LLIYKFDEELIRATFLERLNKFLIEAEVNNEVVYCHLHDPGRLKDVLKRGREILLLKKEGKRKTKYDVIASWLNEWVAIHSGYHSLLASKLIEKKIIMKKYKIEKKEFKYGRSRIDFLLKNRKKCLMEVKGCTLVEGSVALFPDAPTERGRKHVGELRKAIHEGYDVAILFLIMREARHFSPNWHIDKKFSTVLKEAYEEGTEIIACRIKFDGKAFHYERKIPVVI